jgi:hypothetical protein
MNQEAWEILVNKADAAIAGGSRVFQPAPAIVFDKRLTL